MKGTKPQELKIIPLKAKTVCVNCKKEGCSLVFWQDGKCCSCYKEYYASCNWCAKVKKEKGLIKWVK